MYENAENTKKKLEKLKMWKKVASVGSLLRMDLKSPDLRSCLIRLAEVWFAGDGEHLGRSGDAPEMYIYIYM